MREYIDAVLLRMFIGESDKHEPLCQGSFRMNQERKNDHL